MRGVLMGRRGRKRQLLVEGEYWRLLQSGVGTVEACRLTGITRKTGYRWRFESGGIPPSRLAEDVRSSRYLSLLERQRIATLRGQGHGVREIARRLRRSASTVSRELRRNLLAHDRDTYDGDLAHARARERARRVRLCRLAHDVLLRQQVQAKLEQEWSPEQIAAWLRDTYPSRPSWHVCHETIYQALYCGGKGGLRRELTRRLRTGRPLRKRRRLPDRRAVRFIAPARLIHQRPEIVERRVRVGDWEGDLITGRQNRSAIGTLVDRTSRYVTLVHLPSGHSASELHLAMKQIITTLPEQAWLTLTWDQGSEMASHHHIASGFPEGIYFAEPGSPWQRGSNENTNGLLRQYFPKGSDLSAHTLDHLNAVALRLNNRPRKVLNWQTPAQVFHAVLGS